MVKHSKHLPRLCLVEDDEFMGEALAERLRLEGFDVEWYRTADEAEAAIGASRYSVVVSDIRLPDRNGGGLFFDLIATQPALPPFLFITAYGSVDQAVDLLRAGAADYITKPFDTDILVAKVKGLAQAYGTGDRHGSDALGISPAMHRIAESLPRLARHVSALLLNGESGVGKEHVARLFHHYAVGTVGPFIAINCASIPESLMEAELFGFEKGAFTGATKAKRGLFELAHGGVLFLDEIGEMPLSMQTKLLRVLQERKLTRLGSEVQVSVDFRLVCATHRNLKTMVENGQFREDLYYRVHVVSIRIPPLRERQEDIRWFVRHFIETFNQANPGEQRRRLDPRTEQALVSYAWPGNVRELRNAVERACILAPGPLLCVEAFLGEGLEGGTDDSVASQSLAEYLVACERDYLLLALDQYAWHMTNTASVLGITRKTLWEKMRRLGIQPQENGKSAS